MGTWKQPVADRYGKSQTSNKQRSVPALGVPVLGRHHSHWTQELNTGEEVVKKTLREFEKCHDGKEDNVSFGTGEAANTRMLGTRGQGRFVTSNLGDNMASVTWATKVSTK